MIIFCLIKCYLTECVKGNFIQYFFQYLSISMISLILNRLIKVSKYMIENIQTSKTFHDKSIFKNTRIFASAKIYEKCV